MTIPAFVLHELLVRFSAFNPHIGDYVSHTSRDEEVLLRTTTGLIAVPEIVLKLQFEDPARLTDQQLMELSFSIRQL